MIVSNDTLLDNIHTYYEEHDDLDGQRTEDERYVELQLESAKEEDARTMVIAVGMVSFTLFIMLTNHLYMNRRAKESDHLANIDPMTGVKSKLAFLNSEKKFDEANISAAPADWSAISSSTARYSGWVETSSW